MKKETNKQKFYMKQRILFAKYHNKQPKIIREITKKNKIKTSKLNYILNIIKFTIN